MNAKSEYTLIPFLLIDGILVFGAITLSQLDWIVHHTLYNYNLTFSLDWAVPYWTFLRLIFSSFFLTIVAVTILGCYAYRQNKKRSMMPVYICKSCGSILTSTVIAAKVKRSYPKFRFLKNCPHCNPDLLAK